MRNTIATSKKGKVNWKLMINHVSAFLLFLVGFIVVEAIDYFTTSYYLTLWLVISLFGSISMFCLAVLLWQLGTKNSDDTKALLSKFKDKPKGSIEDLLETDLLDQLSLENSD